MNAQKIKLNLVPGGIPPVVHVSQYDEGRPLQFDLYDGMSAASIPNGAVIFIRGTKADQHGFEYMANYSGNVASFSTEKQMTAAAGPAECEIRITKDDTTIGSANFILEVEPSALSDNTDMSGSELPFLEELGRDYAEQAAASANSAASSATSAATSSETAAESATEARNAAINAATEAVNTVSALLSDKVRQAKSWATYANDPDSYGNDHNNSHFWSDRAHSYYVNTVLTNERFLEEIEGIMTDALNRINSIEALINLMYGSVYMVTENGDSLITQNSDKLIISY